MGNGILNMVDRRKKEETTNSTLGIFWNILFFHLTKF